MNTAHRLFTGHLMFGTWKDVNGRLLIGRELIASCEGKLHKLKISHRYIAHPFLKKYAEIVPEFQETNWYGDLEKLKPNEVRRANPIEWPEVIQKALVSLKNGEWKDERKVYISNGKEPTAKNRAKYIKDLRLIALEEQASAGLKEAQVALTYFNNLPSRIFYSKVLENIDLAFKTANSIEKDSSRIKQLDLLNAVIVNYMPFYRPSDKTTRIWAFNEGMTQLKRNVRKALTHGWVSFDLRSAQLAINAKLWKVRKVQKFLIGGGNIWDSLFDHFGFEKTEETKAIFKTALYTICFGGTFKREPNEDGKPTLREVLSQIFEDPKTFLTHPIIKSLWRARGEQLSCIRKQGYGIDAFGQVLKLTAERDERSILASMAQSYEMKLLFPCIEMAIKDSRFEITIWLHDGFMVDVKNSRDTELIVESLKLAVERMAFNHGIQTELECEESKTGQVASLTSDKQSLIQQDNEKYSYIVALCAQKAVLDRSELYHPIQGQI